MEIETYKRHKMSHPNGIVRHDLHANVVKATSINTASLEARLNEDLSLSSSGTGGISFSAGTSGIDVDTTGSVNIASSQAASTAVVIDASDTVGGIDIDAGTGGVQINATGGIDLNSSEASATALQLSASNAAGGITLATGSGGLQFPKATVTQQTSLATGVTLHSTAGVITTQNVVLDGANETFTVTNNRVSSSSVVLVSLQGYESAAGNPVVYASSVDDGSFDITITNGPAQVTSGPMEIGFIVV